MPITSSYTFIFIPAPLPRGSQVLADHMTLTWQPETVAGLAVGSQIKLRVVGIGYLTCLSTAH